MLIGGFIAWSCCLVWWLMVDVVFSECYFVKLYLLLLFCLIVFVWLTVYIGVWLVIANLVWLIVCYLFCDCLIVLFLFSDCCFLLFVVYCLYCGWLWCRCLLLCLFCNLLDVWLHVLLLWIKCLFKFVWLDVLGCFTFVLCDCVLIVYLLLLSWLFNRSLLISLLRF